MVDRHGVNGWDRLPNNEDQQHLPPSRGQRNRGHGFGPARGNFDEATHLPPRGHGNGSPHHARPQQREPLGIPGARAFGMLPVPQPAREPKFRQLKQILPEAALPGPSQAAPHQPVPDASVKRAREEVLAMLRDYVESNKLKRNAASTIECYIDAFTKYDLSENTTKRFLAILTSQLSEERSRSVWTNVLREYCVYISQNDNEELKDCLIDAMHVSRHWINVKLDGSEAFTELEKEAECTPALFSLILEAYCRRCSDDD
ncbi:MAG: hypothetical protein Q9213_006469 [Squamulea squamosa]